MYKQCKFFSIYLLQSNYEVLSQKITLSSHVCLVCNELSHSSQADQRSMSLESCLKPRESRNQTPQKYIFYTQ